ncbi:hypothetical protein [Paenibacillus polymyxa]|nr:hypothetical protein [Paenibacillus polymyxa]
MAEEMKMDGPISEFFQVFCENKVVDCQPALANGQDNATIK